MIPEELLENAPLYVLGELDRDAHAAFEAHLARSPELRSEVRRCAETFAILAGDTAPQEPPAAHVWAGIESSLAPAAVSSVAATAGDVPGRARPPVVPAWWVWAWPAAAAILLGVNLLQWWKPDLLRGDWRPGEVADVDTKRNGSLESSVPGANAGTAVPTASAPTATAHAPAPRTTRESPGASAELAQARARAQRLIDEYRRLAADYDEFAEAVIPLLASGLLEVRDRGVWTVELRSQLGLEGGVSTGLWTRVQELAPANGVALLPDRWRIGSRDGTNPPGVTVATPENPVLAPFALAALNNDEGLGYLDLYNLPVVADGTKLQLWLQNESGNGYAAVGAIPDLIAGGSGGLVFRIPEGAGRSPRVLITVEPTATPPQPSGPVVIEGP